MPGERTGLSPGVCCDGDKSCDEALNLQSTLSEETPTEFTWHPMGGLGESVESYVLI